MSLLQGGLMDYEPNNFSPEEIEKAAKVAKRLLGPPKFTQGKYVSAHADQDLSPGDMVSLEENGLAKKWSGTGIPSGMAMSDLTKGNYGWIQLR